MSKIGPREAKLQEMREARAAAAGSWRDDKPPIPVAVTTAMLSPKTDGKVKLQRTEKISPDHGSQARKDRAESRDRLKPPVPPVVKRGRPRIGETRDKPWEQCVPPMSKASWYRRKAEGKKP